MVVAAVLGLGLGMAGGVMLGGQLFKLAEPKDFSHLDHEADADDDVPENETRASGVPADVREMLPYMPKWTSEPDFEQVRWLNTAMAWLWPSMSRAVHKLVMDIVDPILTDLVKNTPMLEALTIDLFELGAEPMSLGGVKIYDTRDDEVILETPVIWGSSVKIHVSARIRLGPASVYIPLKVEDLTIKSTARVTIRPLVETLPCLGAISICLVDSPYVDLVLKAISEWDLMAVPFLHEVVCLVVKKVCEGICVYPNQIPIPLMPNSGLPKPPCGMLELHVNRIEGLKGSGDVIGKGDPYVRMSVVHYDDKGTVLKQGPFYCTKVISNTRKPVFDEQFRILVDEIGEDWALLCEVFDHDYLAPPDLMCVYSLVLDNSPDAEYTFLREPQTDCEIHANLNKPPPQGGGLLQVGNLKNVVSFRKAPKAGTSFGVLHMNATFVPFFRPDVDEKENEDNPAKAMEAAQNRAQPRKVNADMKGVLTVYIARCSDLPLVGGTCDSYVELKLTDPDQSQPEVRQTEVIMNEPSPRYRQKFDFVYVSATSYLTLTVFDKTGLFELSNLLKMGHKSDTAMGKVRIAVKDVVKALRVKDQFPLQEADQGDMHMTLEWQPVERE